MPEPTTQMSTFTSRGAPREVLWTTRVEVVGLVSSGKLGSLGSMRHER